MTTMTKNHSVDDMMMTLEEILVEHCHKIESRYNELEPNDISRQFEMLQLLDDFQKAAMNLRSRSAGTEECTTSTTTTAALKEKKDCSLEQSFGKIRSMFLQINVNNVNTNNVTKKIFECNRETNKICLEFYRSVMEFVVTTTRQTTDQQQEQSVSSLVRPTTNVCSPDKDDVKDNARRSDDDDSENKTMKKKKSKKKLSPRKLHELEDLKSTWHLPGGDTPRRPARAFCGAASAVAGDTAVATAGHSKLSTAASIASGDKKNVSIVELDDGDTDDGENVEAHKKNTNEEATRREEDVVVGNRSSSSPTLSSSSTARSKMIISSDEFDEYVEIRTQIEEIERKKTNKALFLQKLRELERLVKRQPRVYKCEQRRSYKWIYRRMTTLTKLRICIKTCWNGDEVAYVGSKATPCPRPGEWYECVCNNSETWTRSNIDGLKIKQQTLATKHGSHVVAIPKSGTDNVSSKQIQREAIQTNSVAPAGVSSVKLTGRNDALAVYHYTRAKLKGLEDDKADMAAYLVELEKFEKLYPRIRYADEKRSHSYCQRRIQTLRGIQNCIKHCWGNNKAAYCASMKSARWPATGEHFQCRCTKSAGTQPPRLPSTCDLPRKRPAADAIPNDDLEENKTTKNHGPPPQKKTKPFKLGEWISRHQNCPPSV